MKKTNLKQTLERIWTSGSFDYEMGRGVGIDRQKLNNTISQEIKRALESVVPDESVDVGEFASGYDSAIDNTKSNIKEYLTKEDK